MKNTSGETVQLSVLCSLHFTVYATLALITVYFPLYFDSLGFTKLQIGAVYSIGPILSIAANLLAGIISDLTKSLRRVLNLLFAGQILALAWLLPQREFVMISASMALFYFFQTPVTSMLDSMTLLAANQMNRSFSFIRMFGSLGYAIGAVVLGWLLNTYGSNLTIFLAVGIVAAALVFSLLTSNFQASVRKFAFGGLWAVIRSREVLAFFAMIAMISVAHRINDGFLSVAMREMGASDDIIGVASLVSSVSEIPIFFLLARYGHHFREFSLLGIAGFMYFARMLLLSFVTAPWGIVAIQAMHSVTFGIFYITTLRCLQSMIPDEYRSSGQAFFTIIWSGVAGLLAGTIGGWLYDAFGLAALFRLGAAFGLVGGLGFLLIHFRRNTP